MRLWSNTFDGSWPYDVQFSDGDAGIMSWHAYRGGTVRLATIVSGLAVEKCLFSCPQRLVIRRCVGYGLTSNIMGF